MPSLPLKSLNHLGVLTRDLEKSKAFYRDILGFREVKRPNFNFAGAWIYNYGLMIHLIEGDRAAPADGNIETRGNHVALQADDLDAVQGLLDEHGIAYKVRHIADTGVKQIFFQDPDGYAIEVGTYPPTPDFL